jgi:magnesium-transporting ATPase (P-type)
VYANNGLRTLFLAERTLSRKEYDAWNEKYNKAKEAMNDDLVAQINAEIEVELTLIGSTAIEDKL